MRYSARVFALTLAVAIPTGALAQQPLDFRAAQAAMNASPAGTAAADAEVRAAEHQAEAVAHLYRPTVTASASLIAYEKTLGLDLSGSKMRVESEIDSYLASLSGQCPPAFASIVEAVTGRIGAAVPGLLSAIPDRYDYTARDTIVRPNLTAVMPLYTGGALEAVRDAANAQVVLAMGVRDVARQADTVRLAQVYFGAQLADVLAGSARQTLQSAERHLNNARAMEREGVIARSVTLQAIVARDAAQRAVERAERDREMARLALVRLTRRPAQELATPLFVNPAPVPESEATSGSNGQALLTRGAEQAAAASERLARSTTRPTAYAFGSVSASPQQSMPVDPDWVVGVTVRVPLMTAVNRRELVAAAVARRQAARLRAEQTDDRVAGEVESSRLLVENARRAFLSMDSSLAAAAENLRVNEIAFREGEGTAAQVTDAQTALALAQTQRATAAYEYDVALAALLAISGSPGRFADFAEDPARLTIP